MTFVDRVVAAVDPTATDAIRLATALFSGVPDAETDYGDPAQAANVVASLAGLLEGYRPGRPAVAVRHELRSGFATTRVEVVVDDSPFIVDSILIALTGNGALVHDLANAVLRVERHDDGRFARLLDKDVASGRPEVVFSAAVDPLPDDALNAVAKSVHDVLADVDAAVTDFEAMHQRLDDARERLMQAPIGAELLEEAAAFLGWLREHFVFLGYREFDYSGGSLAQTADASLGVARRRDIATVRPFDEQSERTRAFLLEPVPIAFSKSGTRATVHRSAYPDYVAVKQFDESGRVIGEAGFLGLYTSNVYLEHPRDIPIVRQKLREVARRSGYAIGGFDGKIQAQVLADFPRDELFEAGVEWLSATTQRIAYISERRKTRVFVRFGPYGLFATCLVYVPRDLYDTEARHRILEILTKTFGATDTEFEPHFSESALVRLQVVLRLPIGSLPDVDEGDLAEQINGAIRDWGLDFSQALVQAHGQTTASELERRYADGFPAGYRDRYEPADAVDDIDVIERLSIDEPLAAKVIGSNDDGSGVRLKILRIDGPMSLSQVVPTLENLGFSVGAEHRFEVIRPGGNPAFVQDFELTHEAVVDNEGGDRVVQTLLAVRRGKVTNDGFNRLILGVGLDWQEANIFRVYSRYLKQIGFELSEAFLHQTLVRHAPVTRSLMTYFHDRLDPRGRKECTDQETLAAMIDEVPSLNDDRALRGFLKLIEATDRTNFYASSAAERIVLKIAPRRLNDVPTSVPAVDTFVFAPAVEGVHLRNGLVARGGLRHSDRPEDYRTEVLGLVKAQIVKNAVIVPTGAKGGFVCRDGATPSEAYEVFIRGLLDIADNVVDGTVVPPEDVRRRDGDDPYLVVAADKGTATFSDLANSIAREYEFWLDDAFASGGSNGYDHKALGITARGAWQSVTRHFAERMIDVTEDPVSTIGIGDMSGDVFGNGMLQSRAIHLVAAFNHKHIFVDPNPDAPEAYEERVRLFSTPRTGWSDYDAALISAGGGVFSREAKTIAVSPEMAARFSIEAPSVTPDQLIQHLLKADVDLIWNGGIGTYVKAGHETNHDVGDPGNDRVRVNGNELRARVFAEGGNLGITQEGRVEFSLHGGAVNADFIDNSGGVDCSDHEVNLKIALAGPRKTGELTEADQAALIRSCADEVCDLVIANNRQQARALAMAERDARERPTEYIDLLEHLEERHLIDRELESLPDNETLMDRGFTRPELAVLMANAKIDIQRSLAEEPLDPDETMFQVLASAFPSALGTRRPWLAAHQLREEITATQASNVIIHEMGIPFVHQIASAVGTSATRVVTAYMAIRTILDIPGRIEAAVSSDAPLAERDNALREIGAVGRRTSRWLARRSGASGIDELLEQYRDKVTSSANPGLVLVVDATQTWRVPFEPAALAHAELGDALQFDALEKTIEAVPVGNRWQAVLRDELADDVAEYRARLAVFSSNGADLERQSFHTAWHDVVGDLNETNDVVALAVACRRLRALIDREQGLAMSPQH